MSPPYHGETPSEVIGVVANHDGIRDFRFARVQQKASSSQHTMVIRAAVAFGRCKRFAFFPDFPLKRRLDGLGPAVRARRGTPLVTY